MEEDCQIRKRPTMKRVTDFFAPVPSKKRSSKETNTSESKSPEEKTGGLQAPKLPTQQPEAVNRTVEVKSKAVQADTPSPETPKPKSQPTLKSSEPDWKTQWIQSLTAEQKQLLQLEIDTLDDSWLEVLRTELTQPYFIKLKQFLAAKQSSNTKVFPPEKDIYSWSRLTPLHKVKVLILGQDPYHNDGQAHGLAFSVLPPTRPPPSLVNIYKELKSCYSDFEIPKHGSLVKWASQGVLMLNACLTVDAHQANSHSQKGWEHFTEKVIRAALKYNPHIVIMAWGSPAFKRVQSVSPGSQHLVLRSVHPSPLSASRGWFGTAHFPKANEWLKENGQPEIDWHLLPRATK